MGRRSKKKRTKITTKNAISKSELRAARRIEEARLKETTSSEQATNKTEVVKMTNEIYDLATGSKIDNSIIIENFRDGIYTVEQLADKYEIDDEVILSILICDSYVNEGLTIMQCVTKYNVTKYFVTKVLKENNVTMRSGRKSVLNTDKIVKEIKDVININIVEEAEKTIEEKVVEEVKTEEPEVVEVNKSDSNVKPNRNTIIFCDQEYSNDKLYRVQFNKYAQDIIVAGLCKNRHDMPVSKYVFDTLNEKEIDDPKYIENRATGFINAYVRPKPTMPSKTLVLYCTGFALALSTIIKVCVQNKINLITMHWNPNTESYVPQTTIDIFGKVPQIDEISPLKGLDDKYRGGVYLFGCKNRQLVEKENCLFISLQDEKHPERNSIILFNLAFPNNETWRIYGEFIKMSRAEGFEKRQNIQLGTISISMSGYVWGDVLSKSYNWRSEKPITKRIIQ